MASIMPHYTCSNGILIAHGTTKGYGIDISHTTSLAHPPMIGGIPYAISYYYTTYIVCIGSIDVGAWCIGDTAKGYSTRG